MNLAAASLTAMCLALVGCATTNQPGTAAYKPVDPSQFVDVLPPPPNSANAATVIVKRDAGFAGAALSSTLTVDGHRIVRVRPGQFVSLRIAAGDHLFGVASSDNLGPVATNISREVGTECKDGQAYYFRLFPQVANGIAIDRVSE